MLVPRLLLMLQQLGDAIRITLQRPAHEADLGGRPGRQRDRAPMLVHRQLPAAGSPAVAADLPVAAARRKSTSRLPGGRRLKLS